MSSLPSLCTKSNCDVPRTQRPLKLYNYLNFYALLFSLSFLHRTYYFLREMCEWQMAKSGELACLLVHTGFACLFVCLSVRQFWTNKEISNDKGHTPACTRLTLLRSGLGTLFCLLYSHSRSQSHLSMPFLITRQVHSSIWMTLRTPRATLEGSFFWMHVPDISPIWGTS